MRRPSSASAPTALDRFDLLGDLPTGTTVLEASAGTGKTWAIGALVTRYVAEGVARLDEMLVVTFGRAASQELRERVRAQLTEAERALSDPEAARRAGGLVGHLARLPDPPAARARLSTALATYDAATIATIHQFCHVVLRSLGVAGDTDSGAEVVEDLSFLVAEVVDDLYLARFADDPVPPFSRARALEFATQAVLDPQARPVATGPGDLARARLSFAGDVVAEVDRRKRRRGILSYDDLLSRLARALQEEGSPARERMRARWRIVLVDEFQDTDPDQWDVLDRAFGGHATMVLIGDPKQAIYMFRGGDVHSYLRARDRADALHTLGTNWRSDRPLVEALQALTRDVELGDPRIVVHDVEAHHERPRLLGAPRPEPFRLRRVDGEDVGANGKTGLAPITRLRQYIARDLAADVSRLLASGATFGGRRLRAGDVAILMPSVRPSQVEMFRDELLGCGIASVITSGRSVLLGPAAAQWQTVLEAMEQPANPRRIRAVGLTSFGGHTAASLVAGADDATDLLADRVRGWLDLFRSRGIAAVHEAVVAGGLDARVLSRPGGERLLTDLDHLAQVLHDVARRDRLSLPALTGWLRAERAVAERSSERSRRLDTDAAAVQISTVHGSKGLQYPVVYLPTLFDRWSPETPEAVLFHDEAGNRCLDVGGNLPESTLARSRAEGAGEELRLTYVALTRAEAQVVAWWAPSSGARGSGLTRLLLGRRPGESSVPDRIEIPAPDDVTERLGAWSAAGAFHLEEAVAQPAVPTGPAEPSPRLAVRTFARTVDETWRRTSYSGLVRAEEQSAALGPETEPEVEGTVDETDDDQLPDPAGTPGGAGPDPQIAVAGDLPSPMADLPSGAAFGSLVHAVLEHADPQADDLAAELLTRVREQQHWWGVDCAADDLAAGLLPMQLTPLGPLADDLRLVDLGRADRLCELDFEFPLGGGDRAGSHGPRVDVHLGALAGVLREHLPADDPMRAYADRLEAPGLGDQGLRGYLSGSIDVVLRVPGTDTRTAGRLGHRYLVVDYKTNRLGERDRPLMASDYRPEAVTEAMLHSHYPLQALLYSVVLHRYLRWRLGERYDPDAHLGGILYLYVRGMCGPRTPTYDGQPCGVFSWRPPARMIRALSALLDGRPEEG